MVRPDPIPNSAVKHSLADGSGSIGSARVGCRQIFLQSRDFQISALFLSEAPASRTSKLRAIDANDDQISRQRLECAELARAFDVIMLTYALRSRFA